MNEKTKNVSYYIIFFMTLMILILVIYEVNAYNKCQDNQTKLMQEQLKVKNDMFPKHPSFSICYKKSFIKYAKNIILKHYAEYQKESYNHYDSIIISENNIKNNTDLTINSSYLKEYNRNSGIITCDLSYTITPTGSLAKKYNLPSYTVGRLFITVYKGYYDNSVGDITNTETSSIKTIAKKEAKDVFDSEADKETKYLEGKG